MLLVKSLCPVGQTRTLSNKIDISISIFLIIQYQVKKLKYYNVRNKDKDSKHGFFFYWILKYLSINEIYLNDFLVPTSESTIWY